jgi:hypothetical protein
VHSRVTLVEIDTMRVGVGEAVALFEREVLPGVRAQDGYRGTLVLTTPEGRGMIVTLWATERDAAPGERYGGTLERYMTLFRAPPGREGYEVSLADLPEGVAGRIA